MSHWAIRLGHDPFRRFPPDNRVENGGIRLVLRSRKALCLAFLDDELGTMARTLDISRPIQSLGNHLVASNATEMVSPKRRVLWLRRDACPCTMITNWILRDGIDKSAEAFSPFVAVEHGGVGRRKQAINEGKLRKKGCRINGWDAAPCLGNREPI